MTNPLAGINPDRTYITRAENVTVASGGEQVLFDQTGPGYVRSLWMALSGGNNPTLDARLRVYYDGATVPSIDVDFGTLLTWHWGATGPNLTVDHLHSEYSQQYADGSFLLTFPMPFGQRIRITYYYPAGHTQVAGVYSMVSWSPSTTDGAQGLRLRSSAARWADQSITRTTGSVNTLLSTSGGSGSVVYVSYVGGVSATNYTWLERNFAFYVDGETTPSFETTGTEDTFDSGWYFNGAKDQPLGNASLIGTNSPSGAPYCLGMATDLWKKLGGGVTYSSSCELRILTEAAVTTGDQFCYCVLYYR